VSKDCCVVVVGISSSSQGKLAQEEQDWRLIMLERCRGDKMEADVDAVDRRALPAQLFLGDSSGEFAQSAQDASLSLGL